MAQFNKKLYKINDNIEKKKPDLLNPSFDAKKEQSDVDIPFSLQTLEEIVSLYLKVYDKFNKNEDYREILKENEELLEKRKKEQEYLEKIEKEKMEKEKEEANSQALVVVVENPKENNLQIHIKEEIEEEKRYNDVNYWQINVEDKIGDDILKELD